jgi:hypothetical protein
LKERTITNLIRNLAGKPIRLQVTKYGKRCRCQKVKQSSIAETFPFISGNNALSYIERMLFKLPMAREISPSRLSPERLLHCTRERTLVASREVSSFNKGE